MVRFFEHVAALLTLLLFPLRTLFQRDQRPR